MDDRDATLRWLMDQAREAPYTGGRSNAAKQFEREGAEGAQEIKPCAVTLSTDLAWDLALGAVTSWADPGFSGVEELGVRQLDLIGLAVELGAKARLKDSVWLALAAQTLYMKTVRSLAEGTLQELLARLGDYSRGGSSLSNIADTLTCFDSLLASVDEERLDGANLIAIVFVSQMTRSGGETPAMRAPIGSLTSARTAMADWVIERANELAMSQTASENVRLLAFQNAYSSVYGNALDEVSSGRLAVHDASSWFRQRTSVIKIPHLTGDNIGPLIPLVLTTTEYDLAVMCADWLVENGNPSGALEFLAQATNNNVPKHFRHRQRGRVALIRAAALAFLGDINQSIGELEIPWSDLDASDGSVGYWALGRLLCETGDPRRGLPTLRDAVHLSMHAFFKRASDRMALLLAEREIEEGNPHNAIQLAQTLLQDSDRRISDTARVVLAEAFLALSRVERDQTREPCPEDVHDKLVDLIKKGIVDTADRIRPRALTVLGECQLMRKNYASARQYFREALLSLKRAPGSRAQDVFLDKAPYKYWRRPWTRNWERLAELSLIAELSTDKPNVDFAFATLQRCRTLTHSSTIAELAGFTPEMSLSANHRRMLEDLRASRAQIESVIRDLEAEGVRTYESVASASTPTSDSANLPRAFTALNEQLRERQAILDQKGNDIRRIEEEAYETRGYIASTAEIRQPTMKEIQDCLADENAAVIELVRLDGTRWGLPRRWVAFVVTADGVEPPVDLPAEEIDNQLRLLRGDRTLLAASMLEVLSDLIIARLPSHILRYKRLFIAADGGAWMIPFRSLIRPRWRFVPWKLTNSQVYANWPVPETVKKWLDLLTSRMDSREVTNVISTTHLVRLLERSRQESDQVCVVVGSSGGSNERILCQGLAKSLELRPPGGSTSVSWKRYSGSLKAQELGNGDRLEWMDGASRVFFTSWHTTFTGSPATVARFHFDDGTMTLAEFLSRSRHESRIAIVLACNISLPADRETRVFSRIGSAGFGIMEALQADALVATTNEVTPRVAFVLGRFLAAELVRGRDIHTALVASQRSLRKCKVSDAIAMLSAIEDEVPETREWLRTLSSEDPNSLVFPNAFDWEPFYILGLPTAKLHPD